MPGHPLVEKYFVQPDELPASVSAPFTYEGCDVSILVDPQAYFTDLKTELANTGTGSTPAANSDDFIFIVGWHPDLLGKRYEPPMPFSLDGPGGVRLIDILKEKAAQGVDVRFLGDVNVTLLNFEKHWRAHPRLRKLFRVNEDAVHANLDSPLSRYQDIMATVDDLRSGGVKCCLNGIGHAAGSAHAKVVIVGRRVASALPIEAVGFTGGVDFFFDRFDQAGHPTPRPYGGMQDTGWHDVVSKVRGPIVTELYEDFQLMWKEIVERPIRTYRFPDPLTGENPTYKKCRTAEPDTELVPYRDLSIASTGKHHYVQSLRTLPAANYVGFWGDIAKKTARPLSFAPNGLFTAQLGWQKAIAAAEQYIYMEDWAYWSQDVMVWINDRLRQRPNLKVILVQGRDDPKFEAYLPVMVLALWKLLHALTDEQKERIRVLRRLDSQVHSKTTLIDDEWTIIGSTVCNRRSLYGDIEHSIVVLDADDALIRDYRRRLWGDHFGHSCPEDLNTAVSTWFGSGTLPATISRLPLVPQPKLKTTEVDNAGNRTEVEVPADQVPAMINEYKNICELHYDIDSRLPWGDFSLRDLM